MERNRREKIKALCQFSVESGHSHHILAPTALELIAEIETLESWVKETTKVLGMYLEEFQSYSWVEKTLCPEKIQG